MSMLLSLFESFHHAILDKNVSQMVPMIKTNPHLSPEKQMAIYVDGYRLRLIEAIRSDYPTLLYYWGDDVFDIWALRFIESKPPQHFNLDRYPYKFIEVVMATNDQFAQDVAIVESAIAQVFIQEESMALSSDILAGTTPEQLSDMVFYPRRASRLMKLRYPIESYISQLRDGKNPEKPASNENYLYLVRHHNEVRRHILSYAQYLLLESLCTGKNISESLEVLTEHNPQLAPDFISILKTNFGQWIQDGFFMRGNK
jgi:hypothetical protein